MVGSRWQLGDLSSPIRKRPDYSLLEVPSIIHVFYSKGKLYVHDIFLQKEKRKEAFQSTNVSSYNNDEIQ